MNSLHADVARATIDARRAVAPHRGPATRRSQPEAAPVLGALLAAVAERVAEHETVSEARVLGLVSVAVRRSNPGAAAALIDWNGSEVARQRAFGVAHGVVMGELGPGAQSVLLDQILGTDLSLAG